MILSYLVIENFLLNVASFALGYYIGNSKKRKKQNTVLRTEEKITLYDSEGKKRDKIDIGAVRPLTSKQLEERKHPEVLEAKKEMEKLLDEINEKNRK